MNLRDLDDMLKDVPDPLANAIRHVAFESHYSMERMEDDLRSEAQAMAMDSAEDAFSIHDRIHQLEAGQTQPTDYAPPGVTDWDDVGGAHVVDGSLPSVLYAIEVDSATGKLRFKARQERHVMGSMTQRVDANEWTELDIKGMPDGTVNGQLAYWNATASSWQMLPQGTDGEFLRTGGAGTVPSWTDSLPLAHHATTHITGGDDVIPGFTTTASGLVPLSGSTGRNRLLSASGWYTHSMRSWYYGDDDALDGQMLRFQEVAPDVFDWQAFLPDDEDMEAWFSGAPTTADGDIRILTQSPFDVGMGVFEYVGEIKTLADALLAMDIMNTSSAFPKYLRVVPGPGYDAATNPTDVLLEWEDLCDENGVANYAMPYWSVLGNDVRLKHSAPGEPGQVFMANDAAAPSFQDLPGVSATDAGLIAALPDDANQYFNGVGAWTDLTTVFSQIGHLHDDRYSLIHSHPYALDDHDHTLADMISWMVEETATETSPLKILAMSPVYQGLEDWDYNGQSMTLQDAILQAGIADVSSAYPKYLRIVYDGGTDKLEFDDLCDDAFNADTLTYWKSGYKLGSVIAGTEGQVLMQGASGPPSFQDLPGVSATDAGLIAALPDDANQYFNGVGAWTDLTTVFSQIGHLHDDRYSLIHSHPYAAIDHDHTLADMISWMVEETATETSPLKILAMSPVDQGLGDWDYNGQSMTLQDAILQAGIADVSSAYPKYLRIVDDGGTDKLEFDDLCDDVFNADTLTYWKSGYKLGSVIAGTEGQVLMQGASGPPSFQDLPDVSASQKGLMPQLPATDGANKVLDGLGAWVAMPSGGGEVAPGNPTAVTTLGSAAEGSESALTNTFTAAGTNGLDMWVVSRVVYDHTGSKILYKMMRKMRFSEYGRLYSVSGETRVEVDQAVSVWG